MRWLCSSLGHLVRSQDTHIVRAQRHTASTACTELGATIGAKMATSVRELGLMTDSTRRGIIFVLALVPPCFLSDFSHLFLIAFKLLMQSPGQKRQENKLSKWRKIDNSTIFFLQRIKVKLCEEKQCMQIYFPPKLKTGNLPGGHKPWSFLISTRDSTFTTLVCIIHSFSGKPFPQRTFTVRLKFLNSSIQVLQP